MLQRESSASGESQLAVLLAALLSETAAKRGLFDGVY